MTSHGSAYGRFQRAIERGHLVHAEVAAREVGWLNLADALAVTVLIAKQDVARFGRASARWHSRFAAEVKGLEAWESRLVLAALEALPHDEELALAIVERVARVHGIRLRQPGATGSATNSPISSNVIA